MSVVALIRDLLGGEALIGPWQGDQDVIRLTRHGVPTEAVDHFLKKSQLSFDLLDPAALSRSAFMRFQMNGLPLDSEYSSKILRIVRMFAAAQVTLGDGEKAFAWVNRENGALEGQKPLALVNTESGLRTVETLLGRIAHGIAA